MPRPKQQQNDNNFGARLKQLRGTRSQAEFAEFLGLASQQTYRNYEEGRIPKRPILQQIARRCVVSPGWLLGTTEEEPLTAKDLHVRKILSEGVAGAARRMTDDELVERIEEHAAKLKTDHGYMVRAHAQTIAELAHELGKRPEPFVRSKS